MIDHTDEKNIKVITTVQTYSMRNKIEELVSQIYENYEVEKKSDYVYYGGYAIIWYANEDELKLFNHRLLIEGYRSSLYSGKIKENNCSHKLKIIHVETEAEENVYA